MYLFLVHLSLSDVFLTINIGPKMLHVILANGSLISYSSCISQLYFFGVPTIFECFFLSSMSYDRYLAVCKPLHYQSVMDIRLQTYLILWPWFLGFSIPLMTVISVNSLEFCRQNVIDHFFCDLAPLLKLSCSDTSVVELEMLVVSMPILPVPCVLILITYSYIAVTVLKISSATGRRKAFSTCSSHLIVVCTYYGTLLALYLVPSGKHLSNINKTLSLLYTVITPMCNPIIYTLRNQEIMISLAKLFSKFRSTKVV
ncbi:PREDICTED: olfactory receptor 10A2-like [Nanorana parkeri]|uniref:olfactory receptor 10A2-like n=1 Tax=Nanorana parkeri TaxID=125878 RepID=UPI00085500B0|nr:PREDICTED: olfactory receptor 10A2-like [Nanorana parkeri]